MSCQGCADIKEVDGIRPDCETGRGCPVPSLTQREARVLELRAMLVRLRGLVDASAVLRLCGVSWEELLLLAAAEDELRKVEELKGSVRST